MARARIHRPDTGWCVCEEPQKLGYRGPAECVQEHSRACNALMKNTVGVYFTEGKYSTPQGEPSDGVSVGSVGEEARSLSSGEQCRLCSKLQFKAGEGRGP